MDNLGKYKTHYMLNIAVYTEEDDTSFFTISVYPTIEEAKMAAKGLMTKHNVTDFGYPQAVLEKYQKIYNDKFRQKDMTLPEFLVNLCNVHIVAAVLFLDYGFIDFEIEQVDIIKILVKK